MLLKCLRQVIGALWFLICCVIGVLLGFLAPFRSSNMSLIGHLFGVPVQKVFGLKYVLKGEEYLSTRPCVFISNHQNNMDLVTIGSIFPPRSVTLGKIEIIFIPVFGLLYWLFGNILIVRGNRRKSKRSMEKVTRTIREKNISVWIMPEGTRGRGRGLLPFKSGAFRTAIEAQVPIVPVCLNNYHNFVDLKKWNSGTIACQVLPPIETKGMTLDNLGELTQKCQNLMKETIDVLDREYS